MFVKVKSVSSQAITRKKWSEHDQKGHDQLSNYLEMTFGHNGKKLNVCLMKK